MSSPKAKTSPAARLAQAMKTAAYVIVWIIAVVAVLILCRLMGLDAYGL